MSRVGTGVFRGGTRTTLSTKSMAVFAMCLMLGMRNLGATAVVVWSSGHAVYIAADSATVDAQLKQRRELECKIVVGNGLAFAYAGPESAVLLDTSTGRSWRFSALENARTAVTGTASVSAFVERFEVLSWLGLSYFAKASSDDRLAAKIREDGAVAQMVAVGTTGGRLELKIVNYRRTIRGQLQPDRSVCVGNCVNSVFLALGDVNESVIDKWNSLTEATRREPLQTADTLLAQASRNSGGSVSPPFDVLMIEATRMVWLRRKPSCQPPG